VSLLYALKYIDSIGGYATIECQEQALVARSLERIQELSSRVHLIGKTTPENRVGVFTFAVDGIHQSDLAEALSRKNICVRAGFHCAEPLLRSLHQTGTIRMSAYLYNDIADIDTFFDEFILLTK